MGKQVTVIDTDAHVRAVSPRSIPFEVPVKHAKGLKVRIYPSGRRAFVMRYRAAGVLQKLTWPDGITITQARKLCADVWFSRANGGDPAVERRQRKARERADAEAHRMTVAASRGKDETFAALVPQYVDKHVRKHLRPRSQQSIEQNFGNYILAAWRDRNVHEIVRRDVIRLVEDIAEGKDGKPPKPIAANRTLSALGAFYNWLIQRDIVGPNASPCTGVAMPGKETKRKRVLDEKEIAALWRLCRSNDLSPRYATFVALLLLTGQRRSECADLPFSEIDRKIRQWRLPGERTKNGLDHVVPLSAQAWKIVTTAPIGRDPKFVLGGKLGDFSQLKKILDAKLKFAECWTLHDLRRTCATGMQAVGVAPHIIEAVLNHQSGSKAGIVGIYQRHVPISEMSVALQRWADHVERIASGEADDTVVLPMKKKAR
jgi:integrase